MINIITKKSIKNRFILFDSSKWLIL